MDINSLRNIEIFQPRGASKELLQQVADTMKEIDAKRPLSQSVLQRLENDILADRVHSSAVTEGNRLSKRETLVVLTTGLVEAGNRRDVIEVKNLAEAITMLERAIHEKEPLTSNFIRQIHGILMQELDDAHRGCFRREDVAIGGAKVRPPSHFDVPELVRCIVELSETYTSSYEPIQIAAWIHWALARVHPFRDGNGRMARLLQDYILLCNGYPPAPLRPEDRERGYYEALEAADEGGGRPLLELVAKNTLRMGDRYLSIIKDEEAKKDWIASITKSVTEKVKQNTYSRFLSAQRSANNIKSEFYILTEELDKGIPDLAIRFRDYGSLEYDKYLSIKDFGRAERTWFFGLEFRVQDTVLRYIFWFGSHRQRPDDFNISFPSDIVLLVSTEEEHNYYRLLDELEEDRISLREIVPNGSTFWRRRSVPTGTRQEWDNEITGGQIARDFIEEVVRKLGLI